MEENLNKNNIQYTNKVVDEIGFAVFWGTEEQCKNFISRNKDRYKKLEIKHIYNILH